MLRSEICFSDDVFAVEAHQRGVAVQVILDKSTGAQPLSANQIRKGCPECDCCPLHRLAIPSSAWSCRHFYTTHTEPRPDGRIRRRKECDR